MSFHPLALTPNGFSAAPTLKLHDPLAALLGAAPHGLIEYGFADVVKLAGHSCPPVASAYLMACRGLTALYGSELPQRGGIRAELAGQATAGVVGVIASVLTLLTGATGQTGFKGLGGRFDRRHLLAFGIAMQGQVRFTRVDTGAQVEARSHLDRLPTDPQIGTLMPRCVAATATADELMLFQSLWQERVRALLVDHADEVIELIHP